MCFRAQEVEDDMGYLTYNKALHWPPDVSFTGLAISCSSLRMQGPRQILAPVSQSVSRHDTLFINNVQRNERSGFS
jgi:hypothetical protein